MTDIEALSQYVRTQDPEAFTQVVMAYQGVVYAACRRHLQDAAQIQDAVQETFLKLARNASRVNTNIGSWLYRCAVNTTLDHIRSEISRRKREAIYEEDSDGRVAFSATGDATWKEVSEQIDTCMAELDDAQRELIVQYYFRQRTLMDIAAELNLSHTGVKKRIDKALALLRSKLETRDMDMGMAALVPFLQQEMVAQVPAAVTENLIKIGVAGIGKGTAAAAAGGKIWLTGGPARMAMITIGVALTGVAVWQAFPRKVTVAPDRETGIFYDDLEQGAQKWQTRVAVPDPSIFWNIRLVESADNPVLGERVRDGKPTKVLVLKGTGENIRAVQITCPGLSKLTAYAIDFDVYLVSKESNQSKVQLGVPVPGPGDKFVKTEEPAKVMRERVWLHIRRDFTPTKTSEGEDAQILTTTVDGEPHSVQMLQIRTDAIAFVAQNACVEIDNLKVTKLPDAGTGKPRHGAD